MKKTRLFAVIFAVLFTAQACNLFSLTPQQGSGPKGVFKSTDQGETWEQLEGLAESGDLSNFSVNRIQIESRNTENVIVASSNRGVIASDNKGDTWVQIFSDFVARDVMFSPVNDQEIFIAGMGDGFGRIIKTIDRGGTWVEVFSEPQGETMVVRLQHDSNNPNIFFGALSSGTVIKSTDGGTSWNKVLETKREIVDMATAGEYVYVLDNRGGLHRSQDAGSNWTELEVPTQSSSDAANVVYASPHNSSHIFVGTEDGLFMSSDAGDNWQTVNLPVSEEIVNVTSVEINPRNSREVYAAIRTVLYRSRDGGDSWQTVGLGSKRTINDLEIDKNEPNIIYAGLR